MSAEQQQSKPRRVKERHPCLEGISFPLSDAELAAEIAKIKTSNDYSAPEFPKMPTFRPDTPIAVKVRGFQKWIESFEYNYTGINHFDLWGVGGCQSLFRVLDIAKKVCRIALPIKCVDAVYLAILATQGMADLDRVPLVFKSRIDGHSYGHVVLVLRYNDSFGAMGLSRRKQLMYKPIEFQSFSELVHDFVLNYEKLYHKVTKIKVGLPIPHEINRAVQQQVTWKHAVWDCTTTEWTEIEVQLNKHMRECSQICNSWLRGSGGFRAVMLARDKRQRDALKEDYCSLPKDRDHDKTGCDRKGKLAHADMEWERPTDGKTTANAACGESEAVMARSDSEQSADDIPDNLRKQHDSDSDEEEGSQLRRQNRPAFLAV